ncbi:CocE/NonD family hydrolase [Mycobacterium haemophilum]|uniref:Hydrolase n=1 Tax=Mycobacterium haemophilum TaxID=29311 RepID=A0A0I9V0K0_9MYCO|nr:CocE/NonD family hydrolase [Mycobacterium haemophilum]KLO29159.1 hydrolase [Mycobacterium haemophilum]KLO35763.1 hydrolase [Mycobacterium haemophilum]KLO41283.1 hydrolase [Mycobacterium haemophilum]KLO49164.1 hydrolase [Mycobacterium haemophilum]
MRTLTTHVGGNAAGGLLGLPRATTRYTVRRVQVPMRDGIGLVADHYAPLTSSPAGTVLVRGPYGRRLPFSLIFGRLYAARGYHVVLQSVRGTFGAGGVFEPMINEAADGADTVTWLRQQPWFTGRFGTVGLSYLGFTQWALLHDPPPELAAAVITAAPHDFHASVWDTGSFTINDFLGWSDLISHQEDRRRIRSGIRQLRARRKVARAAGDVPLGAAARTLLGTGAPWFESWVEHCDHNDPFWTQMRLHAALDRVEVPVLLVGGWQDIFLRQTLQQYRQLRDRDVHVALTIGPWTHTQMLTKGLAINARESLAWLDTHLGEAPARRRRSTVRVFVAGQGWRNLPDWPPATTDRVLYLAPGGRLSETAPVPRRTPATFRCDPADPTPTTGGPMLLPSGGYRDDSRLALRDDVLAYTGAPLTQDLYVYGNPVVELAHSSDNPNVDLFVRVSEVDAKGRSRNVSDSYRRLSPAQHVPDLQNLVSIELDAIAHRFSAGSRIRVLVAGSWFPRYARNLGTQEPMLAARQLTPATHAVHFGPSRLVLPVGQRDPSADRVTDPVGDAG